MASYTKDKKTGKPVLQSRIETPYQPDQRTAAPNPVEAEPPTTAPAEPELAKEKSK